MTEEDSRILEGVVVENAPGAKLARSFIKKAAGILLAVLVLFKNPLL